MASKKKRVLAGTSINKWTDIELKLIEQVKKYPYLYNGSTASKVLVSQTWERVAMAVGAPAAKCKYRWSSIRKCYRLNLLSGYSKRRANSKLSDGSLSFLNERFLKKDSRKLSNTLFVSQYQFDAMTPASPDSNTSDNIANKTETSNKNQAQSSSGSTVLTQDIIEYLLQRKSNETPKENNDLFQSMASFVPDDIIKTSITHSDGQGLKSISTASQPDIINTTSNTDKELVQCVATSTDIITPQTNGNTMNVDQADFDDTRSDIRSDDDDDNIKIEIKMESEDEDDDFIDE